VCKQGPTESCLLKHLFQDFKLWAEENNEFIMTRPTFTERLASNGFSKSQKKTNKGFKIIGTR
jgi:hypothetical protein